MHPRTYAIAPMAAIMLTFALPMAAPQAAEIIFSASGTSPAGIQATVDAYRTDLGTLNANVAGSFGSGRREINWDGVPDALAAPRSEERRVGKECRSRWS